jgi:hypothetical protein
VQRREGGKWLDFPLPTKTDESGWFTAYVELGQPGRYAFVWWTRLRSDVQDFCAGDQGLSASAVSRQAAHRRQLGVDDDTATGWDSGKTNPVIWSRT